MATKNKIEDFGEKIGGARKDLAALKRYLRVEDVSDWTEFERKNYINKKYLWKAPDYQAMVDNGLPKEVVYFVKRVRDAVPATPPHNTKESQDRYIQFIADIREALDNIKSVDDAKEFFNEALVDKYVVLAYGHTYRETDAGKGLTSTKLLRAAIYRDYEIQREMQEKQFLYSEEEKLLSSYSFHTYDGTNVTAETDRGRNILRYTFSFGSQWFYNNEPYIADISNWKPNTTFVINNNRGIIGINFDSVEKAKEFALTHARDLKEEANDKNTTSRKKRFIPPQLEHIRREGGADFREGVEIQGEDMLQVFKFRGGEFGNWESQLDRQTNLNMSFEAFMDLAVALGIKPEDISLGGNLAIAYGARGHSSAIAHFEPDRNVINLTKMKGAGSLAHEWGHALDYFIARKAGLSDAFATESFAKTIISPVINAMRYVQNDDGRSVTSNYHMDSKKADKEYCKEKHGYWASETEMFARAFACYVYDKLKNLGIRSDYLCGHANLPSAIPKGKEREAINAAIDDMIAEMKSRGYLNSIELKTIPMHENVQTQDAARPEEEDYYKFKIFQLKKDGCYRNVRFCNFNQNRGANLNSNDYELVYSGDFRDIKGSTLEDKLENIFMKFNIDRPSDFTGHSLSVSDVITVENDKGEKAFYVDDIGFTEFADFFNDGLEKYRPKSYTRENEYVER